MVTHTGTHTVYSFYSTLHKKHFACTNDIWEVERENSCIEVYQIRHQRLDANLAYGTKYTREQTD